MDTRALLAALKAEKDRLDKAITAFSGPEGVGKAHRKRRKRRGLSAGSKRRISQSMKKAWAERKKG